MVRRQPVHSCDTNQTDLPVVMLQVGGEANSIISCRTTRIVKYIQCTNIFSAERHHPKIYPYPFNNCHPQLLELHKVFCSQHVPIDVVAFIFLDRRSFSHNPVVASTTALAVTPTRCPSRLRLDTTKTQEYGLNKPDIYWTAPRFVGTLTSASAYANTTLLIEKLRQCVGHSTDEDMSAPNTEMLLSKQYTVPTSVRTHKIDGETRDDFCSHA